MSSFQSKFLQAWGKVSEQFNEADAKVQNIDWENAGELSPNADEALLLLSGAAGDVLDGVQSFLADLFDKPPEE